MNEEFKEGDKVTYLGNPGEITFVGKDQMDRTYYSVSYDKGNGKTKASNLYNKGGEIKAVDSNVLQESKRDYYWEQKAENFIKTGSYYDGPW